MAQYMLLLHDSPQDFADVSLEDMQGIIAEYTAWREKLASEGRLVDGKKLADEGGKALSMKNGSVSVVDGPYSEAKEVLGGYFTIEAADYDEAVAISQDCPHLKYGERIELRAVDPMHD